MLEHWLYPVQTQNIEGFDALEERQFGRKIALYTEGSPVDLQTLQIAIIGIGTEDADAVRSFLYRLSHPFGQVVVGDLGNFRKHETSFIVPLLAELLASGIVPVLIGYVEDFTLPQFQAFRNARKAVNLALIDEKIRYAPATIKAENYFLHQVLDDAHLFNCAVIGLQTHFMDPSVLSHFEDRNFELVRLGKLRSSLDEAEPIIRDADVVSFNLAALKMSEAPAQLDGSPNGLTSEDACQIAHFAGLSDKLMSFGIYGFRQKFDRDQLTAQVVAQMIWYFVEGFASRQRDFPMPSAMKQMTQYVVEIPSFEYRLTFWRSNRSNLWWMEIPMKAKRKHDRHRLVPCSYNDYLQACNDDLPERLFNAFRRFTD
jgi:formiminoglutamase